MNKLIDAMADDMRIRPHIREEDRLYEYRVIYSALGLWCLRMALFEQKGIKGISKKAQSIRLRELLTQYLKVCPNTRSSLNNTTGVEIASFIRNVYEQTGYLITIDGNRNVLNCSGEAIELLENDYLYLGLPGNNYAINGLGIHSEDCEREIDILDYLIRDELSPEEFLEVNYDECDFEEKDIDIDELEFFNPYFYGNATKSWSGSIKSNLTMARKGLTGPYYRVIRKSNEKLIFADENNKHGNDKMAGLEFRRLYIALKHHYDNPMQLLVCPIDDEYSYIRVLGQLPNREYYFILMNAWPQKGFWDRNNYIIRNTLYERVVEVVKSIGFTVRNGEFYG